MHAADCAGVKAGPAVASDCTGIICCEKLPVLIFLVVELRGGWCQPSSLDKLGSQNCAT